MKKAICTIVVALMMPLAVMADSYGSLWKQYELLQRKNQPRSAIHVLEQIAAKARADKAYGQLIKAQFGLMDAWEDLAPDSLGPQLQRLRGEALRAEKTDRAAAAIYYSVLGSRYRDSSRGMPTRWKWPMRCCANRCRNLHCWPLLRPRTMSR
nr:hypothetical protein [Segatella maculosa]